MGNSIDWQAEAALKLSHLDVYVLNPRRDDWDSSWEQRARNSQFRGQVEWELEAQEKASLIIMYFDPASKSPITLLELGLFASSGRLVVCCPDGFWRKGNVEIVCERYGVKLFSKLPDMLNHADRMMRGL